MHHDSSGFVASRQNKKKTTQAPLKTNQFCEYSFAPASRLFQKVFLGKKSEIVIGVPTMNDETGKTKAISFNSF